MSLANLIHRQHSPPTVARIATVAVANAPAPPPTLATLALANGSAPHPRAANRHWLARLADGREMEIVTGTTTTQEALQAQHPNAVIEPYEPPPPEPPATPLNGKERAAITAWLNAIGESDPDEVGRELTQCERDAAARRWFLDKAAELPPVTAPAAPTAAVKPAAYETVAAQIERVLSGLALLPDDRRYIEQRLRELGGYSSERESLLTEYRRRWEQAATAEPSEIKRDNAGRRAAYLGLLGSF